ncbi:MAG: helix-turn-helix domain-containing protein [Nitrososphaerales archaeon]|jgi:predicted DNA binding protein
MRRLIVELSVEDVIRSDADSPIRKIESLELVQLFNQSGGKLEAIMRVAFKYPHSRIEDIFPKERVVMQLLDHDRKTGVYTYFIKSKEQHTRRQAFSLGGYVSMPFEMKDGKIKMNFLGNSDQIKSFLKRLETLSPHYKIVSLADAKFSPDSPLSSLTEKQRRVLLAAFNLGYYDLPRRVNSKELARKLNLVSSTLISHRRKAERRVLAKIING